MVEGAERPAGPGGRSERELVLRIAGALLAASVVVGGAALWLDAARDPTWTWREPDALDLTSSFSARCELHDRAMEVRRVPMLCGCLATPGADDDEEARAREFPNANSAASYDYEHTAALVRSCDVCREAEQDWRERREARRLEARPARAPASGMHELRLTDASQLGR